MVNSQVVAETINAFKLDQQRDNIPNPIPVIEVGMKLSKSSRLINAARGTTGTISIMTTPTEQQFYLRRISMCIVKDATCDIPLGIVACSSVINGVTTSLAQIPVLTLTAQEQNIVVPFNNVKLDKSAVIQVTSGAYSVGSMHRTIEIEYMIDEVQ
jgi:hypothetical protein